MMRSYLSLIPISARVRKRQNRMMILCIVISVLLVTVIFSAADMFIRGETAEQPGGAANEVLWHDALHRREPETSYLICENGGAQLVQKCNSGWSCLRNAYHLGDLCAAALRNRR